MCKLCAKNDLNNNNIKYIENINLSSCSTFKIGGKASIAVFPTSSLELIKAIEISKMNDVKYAVIGNASNTLFDDDGYDGLIIFTNDICHIAVIDDEIICGCGASLPSIVNVSMEKELTGAEFLVGIPGTVGGATYMNCGALNKSFSDIFVNGTFYQNGELVLLDKQDLEFGFRKSKLVNSDLIILDATLKLSHSNKDTIKDTIQNNLKMRALQPISFPSAGSVFLPYEGTPAWKYIDQAGLRGYSIGGAKVSEQHAGFIINTGNATSSDVKKLIEHIIITVKEKFGILLSREIIYIGD